MGRELSLISFANQLHIADRSNRRPAYFKEFVFARVQAEQPLMQNLSGGGPPAARVACFAALPTAVC